MEHEPDSGRPGQEWEDPADLLVRGQAALAEGRPAVAREALERVLACEGPSPVLLDALSTCYAELNDPERAGEFQSLAADLDPRPLTREEHEGGPAMTDDTERTREPDEEGEGEAYSFDDSSLELDDTGDPADALRELEALLQGVGASLEGDEEGEEGAAEEPAAGTEETGPGLMEAVGTEPEPEAGGDRSDIWKKILEQAEAAERGEYHGIEDLEALAELAPVEPEEEAPAEAVEELEVVGEDLEEPPVEPEEEAPAEAVEELEVVGAVEIDTTAFTGEAPEAEGLEVLDSLEIDATAFEGTEAAADAAEAETPDDSFVLGPVELSDEVVEQMTDGLDIDTSFKVMGDEVEAAEFVPDSAGEEAEPAAGIETAAEPGAEMDVDEALRALEEELGVVGEDAGAVGAVGEIALDDALDEIGSELEAEPGIEELGAEADEIPVPEAETLEESVSSLPTSVGIASVDDSIKIAIQAEILVGKGHLKEAVRLFEALQLWAPDRESFKVRLEELRRQIQPTE